MMRARLLALATALLATAPARSNPAARTPLEDTLLGIDYLPDEATLDQALAGNIVSLVQLANTSTDVGLRIRAYRSLGVFDSDIARAGLQAAITQLLSAINPAGQLYLIAAVEALGEHGGAAAVPVLGQALEHELRDVRAAAATALGRTRAREACAVLSGRSNREPVIQVRAAIAEASLALGSVCTLGTVR